MPPELIQAPHLITLENTGSLSVSYVQHRPIKKGVKPVSNASYSVLINLLKDLDEIEDPQTVIAMVDNPSTEVLVKVLRQFDGCSKTIQMSPESLRDLGIKVKNEQVATQIFRAFSVDHYITAAQLIGLLSMVTSPTVRIDTVTAFWARITDRARNFSDVMRHLEVEESTVLGKRIGYYAMLDQNKPSMYYRLRMYNKSEFRVAKILFQMAITKVLQTTSTHVYMKDLKVDNDPKHVLEGPNMWQVLTGNAPDGTDPTTTLDFYFDVSPQTIPTELSPKLAFGRGLRQRVIVCSSSACADADADLLCLAVPCVHNSIQMSRPRQQQPISSKGDGKRTSKPRSLPSCASVSSPEGEQEALLLFSPCSGLLPWTSGGLVDARHSGLYDELTSCLSVFFPHQRRRRSIPNQVPSS